MVSRVSVRLAVAALAVCACGLAGGCSQGDGGIPSVAGASEPQAAAPRGRAPTAGDTGKKTDAKAAVKRKPGAPVKLDGLFRYSGAFRLPPGKVGQSRFGYGGTALAFNPEKKSLFIVGHDHDQAVGEVEIPAAVVNNTKQDDLPVAKVLQPLVKVLPRVPNYTLEGNVRIGGLLVVNGKLLGTAYEYYDGNANARDSHFRLDSLDLAKAKVEGFFQVGTLGGGMVGGYMAEVPEEWQEPLGAKYVTGQAALAIIGRTSSGPALFGFDPASLGAKPAPSVPYVYYPLKNPLGNINTKNKFYNGKTSIRGVLIPPGTGSVLFFGTHNDGEPRYKPGGWVLENGRQFMQVWAYDAREFIAVRNRQKAPWAVRPSETGELAVATSGGHLGGVAFDPATNRLYVSQLGAVRDGLDVAPLIHVFEMTIPEK